MPVELVRRLAAAHPEAAVFELDRHLLLVDQLQPITAAEVREPLAADVLFCHRWRQESLLLGQLRKDPETLFADKVVDCGRGTANGGVEDQFPAAVEGDLHGLLPGAVAELKPEVVDGDRASVHSLFTSLS